MDNTDEHLSDHIEEHSDDQTIEHFGEPLEEHLYDDIEFALSCKHSELQDVYDKLLELCRWFETYGHEFTPTTLLETL